jgi:hypothetical protein
MTSESRSGKPYGTSTRNNDIVLQRSAADFIANYHSKMPHADVAVLDTLFENSPPKKNRDSDYEELPVEVSYQGVPVHIVRAGATIQNTKKKDFDPILDAETGDTYYVFLGDEKLEAFAQLADNSSEWAAFTSDGMYERLSEENKKIVDEILSSAKTKVQFIVNAREREQEAQYRRRAAVGGSLATIALLACIGGGVYEFFHIRSVRAQETIDNFDAQWGNRNLASTPVAASDHTVHNVTVVPFDQYLASAPSFSDSPKAEVPRYEKLELKAGNCEHLDTTLEATDTVTAVQLSNSELDPIGMVVDDANDGITFCAFGGTSNNNNPVYANIIFEITKNAVKK